jgi:hypothetical protein
MTQFVVKGFKRLKLDCKFLEKLLKMTKLTEIF